MTYGVLRDALRGLWDVFLGKWRGLDEEKLFFIESADDGIVGRELPLFISTLSREILTRIVKGVGHGMNLDIINMQLNFHYISLLCRDFLPRTLYNWRLDHDQSNCSEMTRVPRS